MHIARLYRTNVKRLCRLNRISKNTTLHIGQVLKVPKK
jgi:LysM repeat protein